MPLQTSSIQPSGPTQFSYFPSRRSTVHSTKGIVSSTQPLATQCGLEILRKGGNCADAAVAVAAGLNMTEPGSTGIGGDMFCLFYDAKTKKVHAMNGSGRSGKECTADRIRGDLGVKEGQEGEIPLDSVHAVTVPGAPAGWVDTVERFGSGKLGMKEILAPAIELGEDGFPVSEMMAFAWQKSESFLKRMSPNFGEMLKADPSAKDGYRAPKTGEIKKNPTLANTFRLLAEKGKAGFYTGSVADSIIKIVSEKGGHLSHEDLKHHMETGTEPVDPISVRVNMFGTGKAHAEHMSDNSTSGVDVWEHPPNGQGIVALMALGIMEQLEKSGQIPSFTAADHNTAPYLHALTEVLRIAFADANWFVADPNVSKVPSQDLISPAYCAERAKLFNASAASKDHPHGSPAHRSSDTVYFACTDSQGNGISFINSNYAGFGTCIIPAGCGFTLQNRGANFNLGPQDHPNLLEPRKRPYHTIIPALVTNAGDGSLHSVYGVMGGFMQPQGHVQVLLNQLLFGMTPQAALDAPRLCIGGQEAVDSVVSLEEGMSEEAVAGMKELGHQVEVVKGMGRAVFGRGQIIRWTQDPLAENKGVWSAGSDQRGDGAAVPV